MAPASTISLFCFLIIVGFVVLISAAATYVANRNVGEFPLQKALLLRLATLVYLGSFALLVQSHWIEASPFPRLPMVMFAVLMVSLGFALSPVGRRIAAGVPLAYLVLFQGFRLPLELVLHAWAGQGVIPGTMTWTGQNLDIVTGVLAIGFFPVVRKYPKAAWIFNGIGTLLLVNVMRVAIMSSPLPFAWPVEPSLQLAFHLPYALILPVCVGGALTGHVILTRALLKAN